MHDLVLDPIGLGPALGLASKSMKCTAEPFGSAWGECVNCNNGCRSYPPYNAENVFACFNARLSRDSRLHYGNWAKSVKSRWTGNFSAYVTGGKHSSACFRSEWVGSDFHVAESCNKHKSVYGQQPFDFIADGFKPFVGFGKIVGEWRQLNCNVCADFLAECLSCLLVLYNQPWNFKTIFTVFLNSIPPVFSPAISLASIARSVLNCKIIPRFANLFVYCYYCAILYYVFYLQDYFVLL